MLTRDRTRDLSSSEYSRDDKTGQSEGGNLCKKSAGVMELEEIVSRIKCIFLERCSV